MGRTVVKLSAICSNISQTVTNFGNNVRTRTGWDKTDTGTLLILLNNGTSNFIVAIPRLMHTRDPKGFSIFWSDYVPWNVMAYTLLYDWKVEASLYVNGQVPFRCHELIWKRILFHAAAMEIGIKFDIYSRILYMHIPICVYSVIYVCILDIHGEKSEELR